MDSPVIEVHDLWFSFNGQTVLKEVNLAIQPRCFLAVIGPNGGGKTTLLRLMLGLLSPDRGTVRVLGRTPTEAAPRVGYVPQDIGVNSTFPISVFNVALMGRMRGGGGWRRFSKADKMVAQEALERMEMLEYGDYRMEELSGGQRQRVFMARALAAEPELLLLDEPTASVDTKGQSDFYEFLKRLNETVTIIVVSHDLSIVSSYVKSVACVNQQLIFHDAAEITGEMLEMAYHCPVELIAHGVPHRVLREHKDSSNA
jgi:zinc transport system ATP-binding protein